MTMHEIKPKQVRALLLLLVIVPFIPMVLMMRFISEARKDESEAARARAVSGYQQTLASATGSLERHTANRTTPMTPEEVRAFYRGLFEREVELSVADAAGRIVGGPTLPAEKLIAETPLEPLGTGWNLRLYLVDESALRAAVREQFRVYGWTAFVLSLAIFAIAAAAALTVNQQLKLHELKNTSLATVAHELRTPLATMRMLVDTLREGRYRDEVQLREYLELITAENLRLSRLTDHFLTHSRLERGVQSFVFAPVAPRVIVEQAMTAMKSKLEVPGVVWSLELIDPLPALTADREALVTVLINLLENALKYTGEEKRLALRVSVENGRVIFALRDNGIGLADAERKQIFEPFYQVDQKLSRTQEGCGLGLSIVREIVAAHRGRIEIESAPGQGSTFRISLPTTPHLPA
jgi:signal transduction histidine kinase